MLKFLLFLTLSVAQTVTEIAIEPGVSTSRKDYKLNDIEGVIIVVDRINAEVREIVGSLQPRYSGFNRAFNVYRSI
ncbi:hypothetical protein [Candidatus Hartigia pinicola]